MPTSDELPPRQTAEQSKSKLPPKTTLVALVGALAAAGLYVSIPRDEGTKNTAYRDVANIYTICTGDTHDVHPGQVATDTECQQRLERQLIAHAEPVMACTPSLKAEGRDYQRWAAVSLAYNIGVNAYCHSSVDRAFDTGNWRAGCDAILRWNMAGGRIVAGLTARRQRERAICLKGLT